MIKNVLKHKQDEWGSSTLITERHIVSFSSMLVGIKSFHNHLTVAENSLQLTLRLRQMTILERCNREISTTVGRMSYELMKQGIRKKVNN